MSAQASSFDKQAIIGMVIWVCSVLYSCVRTASASSKLTMTDHILAKEGTQGEYSKLHISYYIIFVTPTITTTHYLNTGKLFYAYSLLTYFFHLWITCCFELK